MDHKEFNAETNPDGPGESINWMPWIAGVLLLLASLWYLKGCRDKVNEMKKIEAEASDKAMIDSLNNAAKVYKPVSQ